MKQTPRRQQTPAVMLPSRKRDGSVDDEKQRGMTSDVGGVSFAGGGGSLCWMCGCACRHTAWPTDGFDEGVVAAASPR
eukprot:CAMPEP_0176465396 /NCGR_PEP_ID=MMETSP0127-20121128/37218_1 /TAXON_ID=938130 /ORGANISM="Platyophrya macrostoma, Strain WH" /LENGTH=77 /DNA_ID=CAMNT_0017858257 /DNA_START=70 /DNA_END=300 /DNA_ORIENTATION=-